MHTQFDQFWPHSFKVAMIASQTRPEHIQCPIVLDPHALPVLHLGAVQLCHSHLVSLRSCPQWT